MDTAKREAANLDRVRFVTQHFQNLQGLRLLVPLGLATLGWRGPWALRGGAVLAAFLLALGARRYYRNAFGVAEGPGETSLEVYPVSIFSPAGAIPRLEASRGVPARAWPFLATLLLATLVFAYFQVVPSNMLVLGNEAHGQHPRIVATSEVFYSAPWVTRWRYPHGAEVRPVSMQKATDAQALYVVYGSLFLSVWLWRRGKRSGAHLALAAGLLGLAALGTSLAFVARTDGALAPFLDSLLPALVYPGVALLLCGVSAVLAGLFDHWQLVHALGRPCEEN